MPTARGPRRPPAPPARALRRTERRRRGSPEALSVTLRRGRQGERFARDASREKGLQPSSQSFWSSSSRSCYFRPRPFGPCRRPRRPPCRSRHRVLLLLLGALAILVLRVTLVLLVLVAPPPPRPSCPLARIALVTLATLVPLAALAVTGGRNTVMDEGFALCFSKGIGCYTQVVL